MDGKDGDAILQSIFVRNVDIRVYAKEKAIRFSSGHLIKL
jgi:hypothetical protein